MAAADHRSPPRALVPLVGVGVLLVLALVAAAVRPPWQFDPIIIDLPHRTLPPPQVPPQRTLTPTASVRPTAPPAAPINLSWVPWVVVGLLAAAAAFALFLLAARLLAVRRMYAEQPDEEVEVVDVQPDLPTLQQGAARAEERLLAIGDPTDAIIAAWLALEEAAHASGVDRRAAQTPSEFTADVLGRTGVPPEPVQTLLHLYLRARFAASPSTAEDLDQARRCVRDLATSWSDFAARPTDTEAADGSGGDRR
jgi:hypothetical protein